MKTDTDKTVKTASARPENVRFTLKMYRDDMGSFTQPGCRDAEDALWHINNARDHDSLRHITMDDLNRMFANKTAHWQ